MTSDVTRLWIRNESDEKAAANGCWFDIARGAWTVWWIERYCKLYEGEWAGENVLLRSGSSDVDKQILEEWCEGGEVASIERAMAYSEWIAAGNQGDWQYECTMRLFGWTKFSKRWNRNIRRFRAASIWIPKKQKKSPTLAFWGDYLLAGDGEQGSKVFVGAKDGNQAGISMKHAIAVVEQSIELAAECKINRNEKSIEHVPTRSIMKPLSSANSRSKNSKEGINGHILIDETHVVDEDFISIISRAGISRAEPLQIEVSTAGNNPEGYGKKRQDYARLVMDGKEEDESLFVAIYEAPQDLKDSDLDEDPCKYGKMANPAWGHTAHEEEYLADYKQSKRSLASLADFKMYRLNIWQHSACPWISMDAWDACAGELSDWNDADAIAIGVDLGSRDDFSAVAYMARFDLGLQDATGSPVYRYELKCDAYIAEECSRDLRKAPFHGFILDGLLRQYKFPTKALHDDITKKCNELQVYAVAFDQHNAMQLGEDLESEGILTARFAQNHSMFNEPIRDFIQVINEGRLTHNGNRLLRWSANNAVLHKNTVDNWMFNKAKSADKIDPIVASVMAFRTCCKAPERVTGSLYLT